MSLIFLLIVLLVFCYVNAWARDVENLKHGVVKIIAEASGGSRQIGAGIVVRVEQDAVYIATAGHVIAGDRRPEVTFFSKNIIASEHDPVRGSVLPGAQVADDLRGLAVVAVRGRENIPNDVRALVFESSATLMSGGEKALVIGHPGGGGEWTIVQRDISNRVVHDLMLDPGVAPRFSGGPIMLNDKVVGVVMSNRGEFGLGITHNSVLNYLEGIGIKPGGATSRAKKKAPDTHKPLPQTKTGKDGAPMVLVPASEFTMGSSEGEGEEDEYPDHLVYLDNFYLDQYEVTVEQYRHFMKAKNHPAPKIWNQVVLKRDAQKPVVSVNWQDSHDYCEWAGKRLPTEAEWEKAARGTDKRTYPWGWDFNDQLSQANWGGNWASGKWYEEKLKKVGSYEQGKSPYGAYDMAGNVSEWVQDWYREDYYDRSPRENPRGPLSGKKKVQRGGSWRDFASFPRTADRNGRDPTGWDSSEGFRCAQDAIVAEEGSPSTLPVHLKKHSSNSLSTTPAGNDGASVVLVPAGKFMMGSPDGEGAMDEHPQHLVELDAFYMDKHEVTNQQFQKFVETTEYRTTAKRKGSAYGYSVENEWKDIAGANWRQPEGETSVFSSGRGMHTVVAVSWEDAMVYCSWAGKRLPTEAEWEYAARAGTTSAYWMGTGSPGSRKVGNLADEIVKQQFTNWVIVGGYEDGHLRTAPVGIFEANRWGLFDMTGNAWEWVADWYDAEYYGKSLRRNPHGPDKGEYRVFRGGSWSDKPEDLRVANREKGVVSLRRATNGFRCAQDVR